MKRGSQVTAAAAALAVAAAAVARTAGGRGSVRENLRMPSRTLGTDVRYSLYLPPGYGSSRSRTVRRFPVLFLLHGGGDDDNTSWLRKGDAQRVLDEAIARRRIPPVVVAMPDARRDASRPQPAQQSTFNMNDADGSHRYADMFVDEFVPCIESAYHVGGSAGRRAIGGLSMGGFGALSYALREQDMFAAAFALSGAHRTDEQIAELDMEHYNNRYGRAWGEDLAGRARLNDLSRQWNLREAIDRTSAVALSRTGWFLDCGAYDDLFAGNAELHLALTRKNVPHRFMSREGTHDWSYWTTGLPAALEFLGDHLG